MLEVSGMTVRYGGLAAVDDVSLRIEGGALVGLIGPNGAGKTTFIDGLTGLTRAAGEILFGGARLDRLPAHKRARLGLVRTFQSLELFEELSIRENLLVTAERSHWWTPARDMLIRRVEPRAAKAVDAAMDLLDLATHADALPGELSLGRRKLVTVARALAAEPKLILLDEPAAGLDSDETLELGKTLERIKGTGVTTLLVDHDMGLVLGVCDEIHVLEFGRLIASGSPAAIAADPAVIRAYLGEEDEGAVPSLVPGGAEQ